jgi:hypothetical protein
MLAQRERPTRQFSADCRRSSADGPWATWPDHSRCTALRYAGQQLLTGQPAQAYAEHFIAADLAETPYGGVYSKISAAALAQPTNAKLAALKQASFQGTTLRGLLLEAYAFAKIGQVMLWGAIASFILAAVMIVLVGLGFWHARRTPTEAQMLTRTPAAVS